VRYYWDGNRREIAARCARRFHAFSIRRPGALPENASCRRRSFRSSRHTCSGTSTSRATSRPPQRSATLRARRISSASAARRVFSRATRFALDKRRALLSRCKNARVARRLFRFGRIHSRDRDERAVRFHLRRRQRILRASWLDRQMVYSCAYFEHGDESLESAQTAKLDYVCRKLRLAPGERLLDIGLRLGRASSFHAARPLRAVRATGINVERATGVARRARARDGRAAHELSPRSRFAIIERSRATSRSTRFSSVGMVEHVGIERLGRILPASAYGALKPGGLFLNHGIVSVEDARVARALLESGSGDACGNAEPVHSALRSFPDGDLVPAAAVLAAAEGQGFEGPRRRESTRALPDHASPLGSAGSRPTKPGARAR